MAKALLSGGIKRYIERMRMLAALLALSFMAGCAYETPIQRYSESVSKFNPPPVLMSTTIPEKDMYRFFVQGATGYVPVSSCVEYAEAKAEKFCERQGKGMILLGQRTSNPIPYPGNFPKAEIVFATVDKR